MKLNLTTYLNKLSYIENEIRNYYADQSFIKAERQKIKELHLDEETKARTLSHLINRSNANTITMRILEDEKRILNQQAFANRLLEVKYGDLVKEIKKIAPTKNAIVKFSDYISNQSLILAIDINTPAAISHYSFPLPLGERCYDIFFEELKMDSSSISINVNPNGYQMTNEIIQKAVHTCAKQKQLKNDREKC